MDKFKLTEEIKKVDDPEILKSALSALLKKISSLEDGLQTTEEKYNGNKEIVSTILKKRERLERVRHSLTEMNERMERPYVVSAELQAVKETLNILSMSGECNSVIIEGEPGTGKTQWAYSEVGQELKEGNDATLVHVRVKDTMSAQDLLYDIDDVRRLSDAQAKSQVPDTIKKEAAIWQKKIIDGEINPAENEEYRNFKAKMNAVTDLGETAKDLDYLNYVNLGPLGEAIYQSGQGKKVYLLIDEIEKGREELMTGILDEIENLTFTISEAGIVVKGDKKNLRIIITTNTEDSDKIPSSFRRRSLYHYIDYPNKNDMAQIIELNFPNIQEGLLQYAIEVFYKCHENGEIQKKPSTSELLAWIRVLGDENDFKKNIPDTIPHKEILLKYVEDQNVDIGEIQIRTKDGVYKNDFLSEREKNLERRESELIRAQEDSRKFFNNTILNDAREVIEERRKLFVEREKEAVKEVRSVTLREASMLEQIGRDLTKVAHNVNFETETFEARIDSFRRSIDRIVEEMDNNMKDYIESGWHETRERARKGYKENMEYLNNAMLSFRGDIYKFIEYTNGVQQKRREELVEFESDYSSMEKSVLELDNRLDFTKEKLLESAIKNKNLIKERKGLVKELEGALNNSGIMSRGLKKDINDIIKKYQ